MLDELLGYGVEIAKLHPVFLQLADGAGAGVEHHVHQLLNRAKNHGGRHPCADKL